MDTFNNTYAGDWSNTPGCPVHGFSCWGPNAAPRPSMANPHFPPPIYPPFQQPWTCHHDHGSVPTFSHFPTPAVPAVATGAAPTNDFFGGTPVSAFPDLGMPEPSLGALPTGHSGHEEIREESEHPSSQDQQTRESPSCHGASVEPQGPSHPTPWLSTGDGDQLWSQALVEAQGQLQSQPDWSLAQSPGGSKATRAGPSPQPAESPSTPPSTHTPISLSAEFTQGNPLTPLYRELARLACPDGNVTEPDLLLLGGRFMNQPFKMIIEEHPIFLGKYDEKSAGMRMRRLAAKYPHVRTVLEMGRNLRKSRKNVDKRITAKDGC